MHVAPGQVNAQSFPTKPITLVVPLAIGVGADSIARDVAKLLSEKLGQTVARKDPVLAAEGAVSLLQKLSPALAHVDSSSGAIGSAVNQAIGILVAVVAKANVEQPVRQKWLERLWKALQDDQIPYIEGLGDYWGELCVTPQLAAVWVDSKISLQSITTAIEGSVRLGYSEFVELHRRLPAGSMNGSELR